MISSSTCNVHRIFSTIHVQLANPYLNITTEYVYSYPNSCANCSQLGSQLPVPLKYLREELHKFVHINEDRNISQKASAYIWVIQKDIATVVRFSLKSALVAKYLAIQCMLKICKVKFCNYIAIQLHACICKMQ